MPGQVTLPEGLRIGERVLHLVKIEALQNRMVNGMTSWINTHKPTMSFNEISEMADICLRCLADVAKRCCDKFVNIVSWDVSNLLRISFE